MQPHHLTQSTHLCRTFARVEAPHLCPHVVRPVSHIAGIQPHGAAAERETVGKLSATSLPRLEQHAWTVVPREPATPLQLGRGKEQTGDELGGEPCKRLASVLLRGGQRGGKHTDAHTHTHAWGRPCRRISTSLGHPSTARLGKRGGRLKDRGMTARQFRA